MSKHSRPKSSALPIWQLAAVGIGVLLSAAAWVYLVGAAIDFGVLAVGGQGSAWAFMVGASFGAVVCLVLVLALAMRGLRALGFFSDYKPRRAAAYSPRRAAAYSPRRAVAYKPRRAAARRAR